MQFQPRPNAILPLTIYQFTMYSSSVPPSTPASRRDKLAIQAYEDGLGKEGRLWPIKQGNAEAIFELEQYKKDSIEAQAEMRSCMNDLAICLSIRGMHRAIIPSEILHC